LKQSQKSGNAYRLRFSDEERADPTLKKPIRRVEKAADKLDKAEAKLPKKKALSKERTVDAATGKVTVRLKFEEVDKPKPPSKLTHLIEAAPALEAHRQISKYEDENVGLEAAHKSEETVEYAARLGESAYHSHKLKPYREAANAEQKLDKANVAFLQKQAAHDNPQLSSNPVSRWQQKQAIKKEYAAAKAGKTAKTTQKTAEGAKKAAKKSAEGTKKAGEFIARHKKGFLIVGGLLLMVVLLLNSMSSCSVLFQAGIQSIAASTYPSEDADMLGAEAAYCAMEAELQYEVDNYETLHPDYDEYHYDIEDIEHDPYVLISMLTAYHGGAWMLGEVQGTMEMFFEKQYQLTETVVTEVRYRTETRTGSYTYTDPETGEIVTEEYEYDVQVPYNYYICYVALNNENLSHLPIHIMSQEKVGMYAMYIAVLGNRPDLFGGTILEYTDYDIPEEYLLDETFAAIIEEAEKYLGYPYVWGGSNPTTSFDCSGFVSWVLTNSGVLNTGRLGAQGLCNICTPISAANARPGDLVFFVGTYDTPGVSHVGIYVGDNMILHAGNPIGYTSIDTSYWRSHFYTFGRLPIN
jgi:hypothetical protein